MSRPLVLAGKAYCFEQDTDIILKKTAVFGNSFQVTDTEGNLLLEIGGPHCMFRKTRGIKDPRRHDAILFTVTKKFFSLRGTWIATQRNSDEPTSAPRILFKVWKSSCFPWNSSIDVEFEAAAGQEEAAPRVTLKSSCNERSARIVQGDRLIAEMKREMSLMSALFNKEKVVIRVKEGVDYAFIAALVLILLEFRFERIRAARAGGGGG